MANNSLNLNVKIFSRTLLGNLLTSSNILYSLKLKYNNHQSVSSTKKNVISLNNIKYNIIGSHNVC